MTTTAEILSQVASGKITPEDAQALIAAASQKPITYKVSEKGGLSAYGLGRFPVTLYREQWERLDADMATRKAFIEANRHLFKEKQ